MDHKHYKITAEECNKKTLQEVLEQRFSFATFKDFVRIREMIGQKIDGSLCADLSKAMAESINHVLDLADRPKKFSLADFGDALDLLKDSELKGNSEFTKKFRARVEDLVRRKIQQYEELHPDMKQQVLCLPDDRRFNFHNSCGDSTCERCSI